MSSTGEILNLGADWVRRFFPPPPTSRHLTGSSLRKW
jgi:hypothetical protein